jgi:hypothetical protein
MIYYWIFFTVGKKDDYCCQERRTLKLKYEKGNMMSNYVVLPAFKPEM